MKRRTAVIGLLILTLALGGCSRTGDGKSAESRSPKESSEKKERAENERKNAAKGETAAEDSGKSAEKGEKPGKTAEGSAELLPGVVVKAYSRGYDNDNYSVSAVRISAGLSAEAQETYPELTAELESWQREERQALEREVKALQSKAQELWQNSVESHYLYLERSAQILRGDSHVLSVQENSRVFGVQEDTAAQLGADSTPVRIRNFDAESGRELTLSDVVTKKQLLFSLLEKKLEEAGALRSGAALSTFLRENADTLCWGLDSEGLHLILRPEELEELPSVQTVSIYFEENPELFRSYYTETPENYVLPCTDTHPVAIDADGDGERELLRLTELSDGNEWEDFYQLRLELGDRSLEFPFSAYEKECYVLRHNGQYYAYLTLHGENDYRETYVVDLKTLEYDNEKPVYGWIGREEDNYRSTASGYHNIMTGDLFYNPEQFYMGHSLQLLGTHTAYQMARVGRDSYPEATEDWMEFYGGSVVKLRRELDCESVDSLGCAIKGGKPAVGSYLRYFRTDGRSWVDLQEIDEANVETFGEEDWKFYSTIDGYIPGEDSAKPIYRIFLDHDDESCINGIEESEIFEGIMYAG